MKVKKNKNIHTLGDFTVEISKLRELQSVMESSVKTAIEMGTLLLKIKKSVNRGEFKKALEQIGVEPRSASDYMRLANSSSAAIKKAHSIRAALATLPKRERKRKNKTEPKLIAKDTPRVMKVPERGGVALRSMKRNERGTLFDQLEALAEEFALLTAWNEDEQARFAKALRRLHQVETKLEEVVLA